MSAAFTLPDGDAAGAFERLRGRIDALPANALGPFNVDPRVACDIVFAALGRIAPYAAELRSIQQLDARAVDALESLALALWWAHAQVPAAERNRSPQRSAIEAAGVRRELLAFVRAMIAFEIVPSGVLAPLTNGRGYQRIADDLDLLTRVLDAHAAAIAARTPTARPDLTRARALAGELLAAASGRSHRPRASVEQRAAALTQRRAFTLLDRAYSEVRRGITLLRWYEGDADSIAPPLRGRRKSAASLRSTLFPRQRIGADRKAANERAISGAGGAPTGCTMSPASSAARMRLPRAKAHGKASKTLGNARKAAAASRSETANSRAARRGLQASLHPPQLPWDSLGLFICRWRPGSRAGTPRLTAG